VFRLWAPAASTVDLVLGDGTSGDERREPMTRADDGWWTSDVPAEHGTRYGYSVDGGDPRPDPRSRRQPDGVHGRSEVVDLDQLRGASTGPRWRGLPLAGSVLYELHVGTFTEEGTFDAAIERLPHLMDLGVDAVEVMPVAAFPGRHGWGYDGVDLYAVHEPYGGPAGLLRFVEECHRLGLGVVLDVVYNHLGPSGNYLSEFGPYFSERHQTNWGSAVNLDGPDSDEVRRFVIDNALMWLGDYGIDGLRLDAVHALVDDSAVHLLEQLATEVEALATQQARPLFLIAESDLNDPRFVRSRDAGGHGLDASWADEWHHALHGVLTGERDGYYEDFGTLDDLRVALQQAWVYAGRYSPHRGRVHGRSPAGLAGHRFVISTQNHDQIGNRAAGDRLGSQVGQGRLRVAAALMLTSPFTPMLFQGEEWGASTAFQYFTDHDDPELARAVSEGRRNEFRSFGWSPEDVPDPQDAATRDRSVLDWSELDEPPHSALLDWYRDLLRLRRQVPDLGDGRWDRATCTVGPDPSAASGWLLYRRGSVAVAANLSDEPATIDVGPAELLLASEPGIEPGDGSVALPPDSVAILRTAGPPLTQEHP
jgi:maltooligosyltrehalose trehalohydrolase